METPTPEEQPELMPPDQKKKVHVKFIKRHVELSMPQLLLISLVFGLVGGYAIWQSFALTPPVKIYQPPQAIKLPADIAVKRQTMQLVSLAKKLQKNPGDQTLIQQITSLAADRASAMKDLISNQPQTAIQTHFPDNLLASLPAVAQANIERAVTLQGTLHLTHGESVNASTGELVNPVYYYSLSDSTGAVTNLHFSDDGPEALNTFNVKVSGVQLGSEVAVNSDNDVTGTGGGVQAATTSITKKVAILLINFADNRTTPIAASTVKSIVFGTAAPSVSTYYAQQSFNLVNLVGAVNAGGDVYGWYQLSDTSSTCNNSTWATDANNAATAAGVNISSYTNVVYLFPTTTACSWAGLGQLPGNRAWINYSTAWASKTTTGVIAHELGHNFGVHHASTYTCTDSSGAHVAYSSTCTSNEYGDWFDTMGQSYFLYQMNAFHKAQLGYLAASNTQTVTASGTYTIAPDEVNTSAVQSLRIPIAYSSNTPTSYIYLDYRQPSGSYDASQLASNLYSGVSVRIGPPYNVLTQSHLLDTTPTGTGGFQYSTLTAGQTFTDSLHNITITTTSASSTAATVQINMPITIVCVRANPTVNISPSSQWGVPGSTLAYKVSVTNNDNGACSSSTFNLTYSLAKGLTQSPASSQVTLAPGTSTTVTVNVTSSTTLAAGYYSFTETAANASATSYKSSATASYNIQSSDTTAPTVAISSPISGATVSKTVTVNAAATDNVGVTSVEIYIDGKLRTFASTASLSFSWDTTQETNGTHTLVAKAYDAAGNVGTSSTVIVTVSNIVDTIAPAVTIVSPTNGSVVAKRATITGSAIDNVGVVKMQIYIDGALRATSSSGSITYTWNVNKNVATGNHTIVIKAYDAAGNVGQSQIGVVK